MKVSVVTSAGGCFCCDLCIYGNYASHKVLLHFCRFSGVTFCYWYVSGSFCNNYAGDCFCSSYAVRSFCSTYAGDSFCSKYMVTIFIVIMLLGVSVAIMQVVFFAVHYAHDRVYCNCAGDFPL